MAMIVPGSLSATTLAVRWPHIFAECYARPVMSSATPAISAFALTKRYGSLTALDAIDLEVPSRLIYGFLGPNGAGKSTAIRLILGFIRSTSGQVRVNGHDSWRDGVHARANVGYLVPADALYPEMTGDALLDYMATLSGHPPRARAIVLDALELAANDLSRRFGTYSKGMKQKLALAAAIQTLPELLILDEPTDGLDPLIQRRFEQLLQDIHRAGCSIFMSSHDLAEVERTCQRVAIIREGRIVAEEPIGELKERHRRTAEVTFAGEPPSGLDDIPGVECLRRDGATVILAIEGPIAPLLRFLGGRTDVEDLLISRPSLEDIFLGYYDASAPRPHRPSPEALLEVRVSPEEMLVR
jgi:ABC-2 type transport system ATP-binding protein